MTQLSKLRNLINEARSLWFSIYCNNKKYNSIMDDIWTNEVTEFILSLNPEENYDILPVLESQQQFSLDGQKKIYIFLEHLKDKWQSIRANMFHELKSASDRGRNGYIKPANVITDLDVTSFKCSQCYKWFNTDFIIEPFCSAECFNASDEDILQTSYSGVAKAMICPICGMLNYKRTASYSPCCVLCAHANLPKKFFDGTLGPVYIRTCLICNTLFTTDRDIKFCCSNACAEEYKLSPQELIHIKVCQVCRKQFKTRKMERYTCGDEKCRSIYKRQLLDDSYSEFMEAKPHS